MTTLEEVLAVVPNTGLFPVYLEDAQRMYPDGRPIYHLGALLPVVCTELNASRFHIEHQTLDGVTPAPLNWWSLLIGGSGSGKSQAISRALSVYQRCARTFYGAGYIDPFLHVAGSSQGIIERIRQLQERADDGIPSVLLHQDELADAVLNKHISIEALQKLHDSSRIERYTVGELKAHQPQATGAPGLRQLQPGYGINALFAMTLSHAEVFTERMASGGFYGRMHTFSDPAPVDPDRMRFAAPDRTFNAELGKAFAAWLQRLGALLAQEEGSMIKIAPEAHELMVESLLRPMMRENLTWASDPLDSLVHRLRWKTPIVAAAFASTTSEAGFIKVTPEIMSKACAMMRLCVECSKRTVGFVGSDQAKRQRNAALQVVRDAGEKGLHRSRLYSCTGLHGIQKHTLDGILETLVDEGHVIMCHIRVEGRRGRPATYLWHTPDRPDWVVSEQLQMSISEAQDRGIT